MSNIKSYIVFLLLTIVLLLASGMFVLPEAITISIIATAIFALIDAIDRK